ncbi:hypothetical protein NLI96_g4227 [Meripilus lineatus]|uniref:Ftr1 protein n=1 Tax=Meripilus lineatus TaxID=2056292 RepID=A0AAD5VAA2_9APHY|nr:hypothetical protein NLI96_g4227 [Physisporinus lineatus]
MPNVFSVPIFFIVFRETLEAAIIVSVLLGLVEQIVTEDSNRRLGTSSPSTNSDEKRDPNSPDPDSEEEKQRRHRLVKKLRWQIFLGSAVGFIIALAIGAAFIAVWFTKASDLWSKSEELWEGIFELVASLIIFIMGITMLKMDRSKAKWRVKLERAFEGQQADRGTLTGKWVLFFLPLITVLREGMEAVVFVGGVSLGQPATSIPIATIVGIVCGLICGYVIYAFASRTTLTIFLVVMTNFILLIGAGLFAKSVSAFQKHAFNKLLGADLDDALGAGDGPGSYDVRGNVWHLNCCNPENKSGNGWTIFGALFGWSNNATLGSVLAYVFYWVAVVLALIFLKFKEGRTKLFGKESEAGVRRRERAALHRGESSDSAEKA